MELRQQFVHDALRRVVPVTELCAAYGISRKTGYKFLARYDTLGAAGLADQSRRPHRSPTALDPVLLQRLLEAHHRHPYWGPRKLLRLVGQRWPDARLAGALYRRALLPAPRARHRPPPRPPPRARGPARSRRWTPPTRCGPPTTRGSSSWATAQYCFPLTVADGYSRMLLACQALTSTKLVEARPVFERLFREYGLPAAHPLR